MIDIIVLEDGIPEDNEIFSVLLVAAQLLSDTQPGNAVPMVICSDIVYSDNM